MSVVAHGHSGHSDSSRRLRRARVSVAALALAGLVVASPAAAQTNPEAVLVERGEVQITAADLHSLVELQIPAEKQPFFWADEDQIRQKIAELFLVRQAAQQAREQGLSAQDRWAMDYFADRALLASQTDAAIQARLAAANLEALAHEYYLAHPDEFARPEQVKASHILIDLDERSEAEALARAEEVLEKVKQQPEQFAELAREYSDDASVERNDGDLGFFARGRMVPPFEEAAFGMDKPGELAGPVKSQFGYHIIRFEDRREASTMPFASVKAQLIEKQRQNVSSRARSEYLEKIRSLEDTQAHQEAIEALVRELPDPKELLEQQKAGSAE